MPNTPFNMMVKQDRAKAVYRGDYKNITTSCGRVLHFAKGGISSDKIIAKHLGRNLCCNPGVDGTACGCGVTPSS
jgi:hypothetical protein